MKAGWKTIRIGDWGEIAGGRQRSPHLTSGALRPYLRVANVFEDRIDTTDVLEMQFTDAEFERHKLKRGDILLNEGQSLELVGRSAIYEGTPPECAFQNTLVRFRAGRECHYRFAQQVFKQLWRRGVFQGIANRTTSIAHLGVNRFADLRVTVPPLETQRVIADQLGLFDSEVSTIGRLIGAKRIFKRGLMQQLLTGEKRFADFRKRPWVLHRFDSLCEELSERNGKQLGADSVMGVIKGVGFEPMRDRVRGKGNLARYKIVPPGAFAYNPMRLNIGSIAYNNLGRTILVSPDYEVFRARCDVATSEFVNQLRYSAYWTGFMKHAGAGSVRVRIYFIDLARLRVPAPAPDEQNRIAETLRLVDLEIAQLARLLELTRSQKAAFLARILSGELSIPSP